MQQLRVEASGFFAQSSLGGHRNDVIDNQLEVALIRSHLAPDPDVIPRDEGPGALGQDVAPDPGHHGAALIAQHHGEKRFAGLVGAALRLAHQEKLLHRGAFLEFAYGLMGHRWSL